MSGVVRVAASGGRGYPPSEASCEAGAMRGATALPGDGGGRAGRATLPGGPLGDRPLPGWVCEGGVWRRETIHSMLRRLPGWDYTKPWIYQITITCADRAAAPLGRLEVRRKGAAVCAGREPCHEGWLPIATARGRGWRPDEIEARVVPSVMGEVVLACWREIAEQWPGVAVIGEQLMPDHFHGIIHIKEPQAKTLGNIVGSFKSKSTSRVRQLLAGGGAGLAARESCSPARESCSPARGRGQNPAAAGGFGPPSRATGYRLWSEGFQDSILFHAGQLDNMFNYLADNPRRRAIKALWPDLFRVVSRLAVDLQLSPTSKARGAFMALGNRFLLNRPLLQIQVSRRDFAYKREETRPHVGDDQTGPHAGEYQTGSRAIESLTGRGVGWGAAKIARDAAGAPIAAFASAAFAAKKEALLLAAKRGAVLLSPCVSDGEREIARLALAAGLPIVAMKNKGFNPLEKPSGRFFDACSDGRLLLLAPAAWPYTVGAKPMTRFDAVAMNRLCQMIAGAGAAEINYRGMKPDDIDTLALAATKEVA